MRIDPAIIKHQVDNLLVNYPELAEDDILRADMLEAETDLIVFLRAIERRRQEAGVLAEAIAANIDLLRERMKRFERRDESLRDMTFKMLQAANLKKLELPEATLSVRAGTPRVVIVEEAEIPDEFCRIKREPDKKKIKEALDAFTPVPGATLSNAADTLIVRIK